MVEDIEREVIDVLDRAETTEDILQAVEMLKNEHQTVTSHAVVNAAGTMLAHRLDDE